MRRKGAVIWLSLVIIFTSIVIVIEIAPIIESADTYYVDDELGEGPGNPPEDFTSIQDAINFSNNLDTVFVYNGTYYENIVVDKQINLTGEDKNSTIIDGRGNKEVVRLEGGWANIKGFTITNSSSEDIWDPEAGVYVISHYNTISDNNIIFNDEHGVYLDSSNYNTISNNNISSNHEGIFLMTSNDNTIINNFILSDIFGVRIWESLRNNVSFNALTNISWAIYLAESSTYNTIFHNNIWDNGHGIRIVSSSNENTISYNNIFNNRRSGINMSSSDNNIFHHNNFVNNLKHIGLYGGIGNVWDDGNGEGNYWDDYSGLDDGSGGRTKGDGIGDTEIPHPYVDQGSGYYQLDNYPFMNPIGNYLFLHQGWNLISIPKIQSDTNLDTVLSSISGSYDSLQWYNASDPYDPWKHHHISKPPHLNDLEGIDHLMGYWIHVTQPNGSIFEYYGTEPTQNQTITLYPGWNMVGYPSLTRYNRTEGLNNITYDTDVDAIISYNSAIQKWEKMDETNHFRIGKGYYIHSKGKIEWVVPL
ncbi:MAG: right-handed parallel beta-helix repeat-containing protein [Thermoplasmata archaeon]|nr:MAG: right-handed parallel beta-helix repeat-containing protein [Thermoplasmata archaeon]